MQEYPLRHNSQLIVAFSPGRQQPEIKITQEFPPRCRASRYRFSQPRQQDPPHVALLPTLHKQSQDFRPPHSAQHYKSAIPPLHIFRGENSLEKKKNPADATGKIFSTIFLIQEYTHQQPSSPSASMSQKFQLMV